MVRKTVLKAVSWVRNFIRTHFHSDNEHLPYYVTIAVSGVLFIIGLNAFVELTNDLAENELRDFDEMVTRSVISFRADWLTMYFKAATRMGDRDAFIVLAVLLAVYFRLRHKRWNFILQATLVLLLASLSNIALKQAIHRSRPTLEHLVSVNSLSYPSGHAMSAMAFYGFLIFLSLRYSLPGWLRYTSVFLLVMLILSIGVSRIYLGVHYPSDVAAGYIGGLIWVTFCAVLFSLINLLSKQKAGMAPPTDTTS